MYLVVVEAVVTLYRLELRSLASMVPELVHAMVATGSADCSRASICKLESIQIIDSRLHGAPFAVSRNTDRLILLAC